MSAAGRGTSSSLVVLNILGCVWLLWWTGAPPRRPRARRHQPRLGRRPHRIQQAAAALVDQPVLPHHRVQHRLPGLVPGPGASSPVSRKWTSAGEHDADKAVRTPSWKRPSPFAGQPIDDAGARPEGAGTGPLDLQQHLRHLPRLVGPGRHRLPQPHRRHLAVGRHARHVLQTVLDGREGVMPAWGTVLTSMGGPERGGLHRRLRAHAVAPRVRLQQRLHGRAGQEAVRRRLRGLPRRGRQGQPGWARPT
jgi:cytochrome c oxidase cbb3-type subunit 3